MVYFTKKTRQSATALEEALSQHEYSGLPINFGNSRLQVEPIINKAEAVALAVNKHAALERLRAFEIPTPYLLEEEAYEAVRNGKKVVGRKTFHSKGRGFYMCTTQTGLDRAKRKGATHFLEFIENAREFRVHIVDGQSIKISEKVFPEGLAANRRNHRFGATFEYPHDFEHKKTLRKIAKQSIEALELDFGAVDILWTEQPYIIEINTAPCLTDENSDTLGRYVAAFMRMC